MVLARLQAQVPFSNFLADVFLPLLVDQLVADVADVHAVVVDFYRVALEVILDVVKQGGHINGVGAQVDLLTISEDKSQHGLLAGSV